MENKIEQLARIIVDHSINVQKNERVLITYKTLALNDLIKICIEKIQEKEGIVFVNVLNEPEISTLLAKGNKKERIDEIAKHLAFEVENFDSFIHIRYQLNDFQETGIDDEMRKYLGQKIKETMRIRSSKRKWLLLNYPSNIDAYKAKMNIETFYNYALDVMTVDYKQMEQDVKPLVERMQKTDKVRITGRYRYYISYQRHWCCSMYW